MAQIHMNVGKEVIHRLRCGECESKTLEDSKISRSAVHKRKIMTAMEGFLDLDKGSPGLEQSAELLGLTPQPHERPSTLEAYREVVEQRIEEAALR